MDSLGVPLEAFIQIWPLRGQKGLAFLVDPAVEAAGGVLIATA